MSNYLKQKITIYRDYLDICQKISNFIINLKSYHHSSRHFSPIYDMQITRSLLLPLTDLDKIPS